MVESPPLRAPFPIWAKLSLLFGGTAALVIAGAGWINFEEHLAQENQARRLQLTGLAQTLAYDIDGDEHLRFARTADMTQPEYRHLAAWMRTANEASQVDWIGTSTRDRKGRWSYVVDSSEQAAFPVGYPIFDGIADRDQAFRSGQVHYVSGLEDEWGRWDTAFAPIKTRGGVVVGVVEVVIDADDQAYAVEQRRQRLGMAILLGAMLSMLFSLLFARWINHGLGTLTDTALAIAEGDLERTVHIPTWDEIGVLGQAFNHMTAGLRERDRIRGAFGRFVSDDVAERALADPDGLALGGDSRQVSILMSDLRGFTALSEQLGPQRMVALLNRYFTAMSHEIHEHEGNIAELLGDGMVLFFGAPNLGPADARNAVRCAIAMHVALRDFCESEGRELEMGIGIDTGVVIAGNIGSERRMKYGVVGDAINLAARLEGFTIGNQVLISEATRLAVGDEGLELGRALDLMAKGRSEPIRCYPVIACDHLRMPEDNDAEPIETSLPGTCWRIIGKQVEVAPHECTITEVRGRTLTLRTGLALDLWDKLKLSTTVADEPLDDVYGTVTELVDGGLRIRITSVPDGGLERLEALRA